MKRLLIIILILLGLFFVFFYFLLGSRPQIIGVEEKNPTVTTSLDSTIKNNSIYSNYVYVTGSGYVLRDRRLVLFTREDTAKNRQADAIREVEKALESYWKWQILTGDRSIEQLLSKKDKTSESRGIKEGKPKNIFNRFFDIFKVADAVNVVRDTNKTCNCDDNLILLSGPDLHLVETILNPDTPIIATGTGNAVGNEAENGENLFSKATWRQNSFLKLPQTEPQNGDGKSGSFIVGIIDSGIDFGVIGKSATYRNPTFNNEVMITPKMESSLNYNFMNNSKEVIDSVKYKHGTNIARIIVKNTTSERVRIVALKTFDQNKVGNLYDNLCAILYAIKYDMKVVNASWGSSLKESTPAFDEVLRRAKEVNMVVVCSAGNQKYDIDLHPYFPACYADHSELGSHVLTVTSKYDSVCQNKSGSGKKIDFTVKTNIDCKHGIPTAIGDTIVDFQKGTSYAAPYVTASVIEYLLTHSGGFSKSGYKSSIPASSDIKNY
jgi:Subtilase family